MSWLVEKGTSMTAVIIGLYLIQLIWLLLKDKLRKKHDYKKLKGIYEKLE